MSTTVTRQRLSTAARWRRDRVLIAMAAPGIAALLAFHYLPLLGNVIAFQDYQPFLGIGGSAWTGWDNFAVLVNGDPDFLNAVRNTLILTVVQVLFVFPIPIVLALMLNSLLSDRMRRIVQNVLYLPHFLSWVVVVAIFQQLLGGSGLSGTSVIVVVSVMSGTRRLSASDVAAGAEALPAQPALQMAMLLIAIVPILIVYPFLQRHFTKGVITGAVKG